MTMQLRSAKVGFYVKVSVFMTHQRFLTHFITCTDPSILKQSEEDR